MRGLKRLARSLSLERPSSSPSQNSDDDYEYKAHRDLQLKPEPKRDCRLSPEPKRRRLSYDRRNQVCIVCPFRMGYDIIVSDLDTLRRRAAGSSILRSTLSLKFDGVFGTYFAFCGLGSKLYMFEPSPTKSVFKIDLSPFVDLDLSKPTLKLGRNDLHRARDMYHPKSCPYAIPTPNGRKALVFSSLIRFERSHPHSITSAGDNDFELYDSRADTWQKLPGILNDWHKYSRQHSQCDNIRIRSYTFVGESLFFIETTTKVMFSLDLGMVDRGWGWQQMDTFFGANTAPPSLNGRFLVIEKELCITARIAYDIKHKNWFGFPLPPFADDISPYGPPCVSIIGDAQNGKYNSCTLLSGIREKTGRRQLIFNLNICDIDKYRVDNDLGESITVGDCFSFFLPGDFCFLFYPRCFFSFTI